MLSFTLTSFIPFLLISFCCGYIKVKSIFKVFCYYIKYFPHFIRLFINNHFFLTGICKIPDKRLSGILWELKCYKQYQSCIFKLIMNKLVNGYLICCKLYFIRHKSFILIKNFFKDNIHENDLSLQNNSPMFKCTLYNFRLEIERVKMFYVWLTI